MVDIFSSTEGAVCVLMSNTVVVIAWVNWYKLLFVELYSTMPKSTDRSSIVVVWTVQCLQNVCECGQLLNMWLVGI